MAEPTETRKLSGLARSIDALFAPPAAPPPASPTLVETALPAPPEAPDASPAPEPEPAADTPQRAEMFPSSQMLDALKGSWLPEPEPGTLAETAVPDVAESVLMPEPGPLAEIPAAPVPEVAAPTPAESPRTDARAAAALEDAAFARAVDDYVIGDTGMRERVETLAKRLEERLALDPLADAVEKLVRAAGDPPDTRDLDLAAAVINPAVASRLVQRLGQQTDEPRRQEYFALCRRLGGVMGNALKGALTGALEKDVRRTYHDALIGMGESVRPMIEGMVADDNRFLVRDGVALLGEMGGPRAVDLVTSALADTDPRVRVEALHALGRLGDAKAGQLVLGSLEDPDPAVRLAAASAAGQLSRERALRPLLRMLEQSKKPDDVIALLSALGQIGDPGAVPAIEKHAVPSLFSKPRTEVRVAAYRALHAIGSPHARDLIRQTAHDKDPGVRVALRDLAREA